MCNVKKESAEIILTLECNINHCVCFSSNDANSAKSQMIFI